MKKKILLITILLFTLMCLVTNVKAASSFKAETKATTNTLKPGEEVTITLSVSDINMGTDGINVIEGKINYDRDIFEEIEVADIQTYNGWTTTYNDEESLSNGKFLSVNLSKGIKADNEIISVKFKVKEDIKEKTNTQIALENVTSNDGIDLINVGTKTVDLKIEVESVDKLPQTGDNLLTLEITLLVTIIAIIILIIYKKQIRKNK